MIKKVQVSVLVPEYDLEVLDGLVNDRTFPSRTGVIKTAIYNLLVKELPVAHEFREEIKHYITD